MTKEQALAAVSSFSSLAKGWNSYSADPIAPHVVDRAISLVSLLYEDTIRIAPTADGTIIFWLRKGHVEVYGDDD